MNQELRIFHDDGIIPTGDWIWVFGSNLKGIHGKGAAKVARVNFRAEYGVGDGPTGRAYAIPTKDRQIKSLPLADIAASVARFLEYAAQQPKTRFFVTAIGTQLAGYSNDQIGPMFADAPANCALPAQWRVYGTQPRRAIAPDQDKTTLRSEAS